MGQQSKDKLDTIAKARGFEFFSTYPDEVIEVALNKFPESKRGQVDNIKWMIDYLKWTINKYYATPGLVCPIIPETGEAFEPFITPVTNFIKQLQNLIEEQNNIPSYGQYIKPYHIFHDTVSSEYETSHNIGDIYEKPYTWNFKNRTLKIDIDSLVYKLNETQSCAFNILFDKFKRNSNDWVFMESFAKSMKNDYNQEKGSYALSSIFKYGDAKALRTKYITSRRNLLKLNTLDELNLP